MSTSKTELELLESISIRKFNGEAHADVPDEVQSTVVVSVSRPVINGATQWHTYDEVIVVVRKGDKTQEYVYEKYEAPGGPVSWNPVPRNGKKKKSKNESVEH